MKKRTYLFLLILDLIIWVLMILCSLGIIKNRPVSILNYFSNSLLLYSFTYQYIQKVKEEKKDKEDKKPK